MNTLYFNNYEFLQAIKYLNTNPYEAKIKFENYLEKYPTDYYAYPYYVSILLSLNLLKEAHDILEKVKLLVAKDSNFINLKEKNQKFIKSYYYSKLKIFLYENKYQEAYDLCTTKFLKTDLDAGSIIFYLENQLNISPTYNRNNINYLKRQITDYQENDFLDHIKKHQADYNLDLDERNNNIFSAHIDINKLFEEIKKYIPSSNAIFDGFYEDKYYFKYDECGRDNNKIVNFIKVVCFHGTNKFITMCPVKHGECLPYIDLNYLKENEDVKVKKISQVEKFYNRYQKNHIF